MARGFINARHKTGGAAAVNEYLVAASQTIAAGDVVSLSANGEVQHVSGITSGVADENILGVCAAAKTSGAGTTGGADFPTSLTDTGKTRTILVYDDLANTVFETSVAVVEQDDVGDGKTALVQGAAVTVGSQLVSRQSATATGDITATAKKTFRVLGAVKRPGNALTTDEATVDCYVEVNL